MTTTRDFFFSPKGGQGCSTTAALRALKLSENGGDVLLLVDRDQFATMCAILNASPNPDYFTVQVSERLTLMPTDTRWYGRDDRDDIDEVLFDHIVIDGGVARDDEGFPPGFERIMVIRNCYLALRLSAGLPADRVILVKESGRSLNESDVQYAVKAPVTVLPYDPAISRAVDAGLLTSRPPKAARVLA